MPVYEYKCSACDQVFEVQQKISDPPLTTCSNCSGAVKKMVSASAFHLKGGGWYADGYSSGCATAKAKEGTAAPACAGGAKSGCAGCCPAAS